MAKSQGYLDCACWYTDFEQPRARVVFYLFHFVPAGFPVCWHVDAPLLPCRCLFWQNPMLPTTMKYGHRCSGGTGFVLSGSCAQCPSSTFCPCLCRECSHSSWCQEELQQTKNKKKKQNHWILGKTHVAAKIMCLNENLNTCSLIYGLNCTSTVG